MLGCLFFESFFEFLSADSCKFKKQVSKQTFGPSYFDRALGPIPSLNIPNRNDIIFYEYRTLYVPPKLFKTLLLNNINCISFLSSNSFFHISLDCIDVHNYMITSTAVLTTYIYFIWLLFKVKLEQTWLHDSRFLFTACDLSSFSLI